MFFREVVDFVTRCIYIYIYQLKDFLFLLMENMGLVKYIFHKVNDDDIDEYTINVQKFVRFIERNKNNIRSIGDFEINGGIVLSFDDALKDIYYIVRSILNKYNINVFIMFFVQ